MVINMEEIRSTIETALSVFLTTQQANVRDLMIRTIRAEMKRNNVTRLWLDKTKVYLTKEGVGFDSTDISLDGSCKCGESRHDCKLLYTFHADTDNESHIFGCKNGHVFKIMWGLMR